MPFRTIGQETGTAFSMGLAEEITTAFSRFRPIVCIAPASVAALVGEPTGQTERWRQLDLDFLLSGSVRRKGNEIRVLLRLINMRGTGEISWGRRFDSLLPDVLNLQDRIAAETAAQIVPEVMVWEGQEAASRPQVDPTAYDLMLRAIPAIYRVDEVGFGEAGTLLERSTRVGIRPAPRATPGSPFGTSSRTGKDGRPMRIWQSSVPILCLNRRSSWTQAMPVVLPWPDMSEPSYAKTPRPHCGCMSAPLRSTQIWPWRGAIQAWPSVIWDSTRRPFAAFSAPYTCRPTTPMASSSTCPSKCPFCSPANMKLPWMPGGGPATLNPGFSSAYKGLLAALGHLGARREAAEVRKALLTVEPRFSVENARTRSPCCGLRIETDMPRGCA